jgi:hypothetical protein
MKITILRLFGFLTVASILGGCGESKPAAPATEQKPTAASAADTIVAAPAPTAPAPATVADPTPAAPPTAAPVDTTKNSTADVTSQFVTAAKAQGDSVVGAIGNDLADKVKALAQSAGGNDALKSQLTSSMRSLASGNDAGGLTSLYQAAQGTSLTPSQMQLAKDVGNLASA